MGLTITYGAYMAEVYRAGIEAVPRGQMEAARSLGMSHGQAMRHVIVPQAVRKVIPPLLNDLIALMKDTSLVSVIAMGDLLHAVQVIYNRTYDVVPHAQAIDFDDSSWERLAPADTMRRLSTGRVCFNWYRIEVTIPERGLYVVFLAGVSTI
jgi:hypothetical protein